MGKLGLIPSSILLASRGQILLKQGANQIRGFNEMFQTLWNSEKYALNLNEETKNFAGKNVTVFFK